MNLSTYLLKPVRFLSKKYDNEAAIAVSHMAALLRRKTLGTWIMNRINLILDHLGVQTIALLNLAKFLRSNNSIAATLKSSQLSE